jgi:hypothetical protein
MIVTESMVEASRMLAETAEELTTLALEVERLVERANAASEVVQFLLDDCLPGVARDGTRIWVAQSNLFEPVALLTDQHMAILEGAQQA